MVPGDVVEVAGYRFEFGSSPMVALHMQSGATMTVARLCGQPSTPLKFSYASPSIVDICVDDGSGGTWTVNAGESCSIDAAGKLPEGSVAYDSGTLLQTDVDSRSVSPTGKYEAQTALPTDNHRREFGKRIAIVGYNFLKAGELTRVFLNLPLSDDVKNEKFVDSESKVRASEIYEGKEHPDCAQTPELCVRTAECYDVQAFGLNEFGECREAIVDEKNPANSRPGGCGLTCIAPSAMGQDVTVIVKRGTQVSNYNFYVKYRSPTIDSITISADSSPLGLIPTVGLEEITITGENFGNGKATVALGTVAPVSASGCVWR